MNSRISDSQLFKLLRGELDQPQQVALEHAIESDGDLRSRWEILCHSAEWPVGSAPQPQQANSERLSGVIANLVSAARVSKPSTSSSSSIDSEVAPSGKDSVHSSEKSMQIFSDTKILNTLSSSATVGLSGIRVIRELGRGGMGIVYEGFDELLQRPVAIKQLITDKSEEFNNDRLLREAQAIASLSHENILAVYGVSVVDGVPVIVEQLVNGHSLEQHMQGKQPSIEQCVSFARQIASGLAAAHNAGVIHRDLKPANILVQTETNQLLIADFGLAKRPHAELSTTQIVAGTPAYMSPEQSRGEPIDHRSDLFSLGIILYRMVTGKLPFDHADPYALLESIRCSEPIAPVTIRSDAPAWLSDCILKLLAKSPNARIQSAQALIVNLDQQGGATSIRLGRSKWIWLLTTAAILLTALAAPLYLGYLRKLSAAKQSLDPRDHALVAAEVPGVQSNEAQRDGRTIWIEGDDKQFATLVDAIEAATDGATIFIGGDLQLAGIIIMDKRLTIASATGARPLISCLDPEEGGAAKFLIQANSDLTLRGLRIDWRPRENVPLFAEGKVSSVILGSMGCYLRIENCEITSSQTGAVVGIAGDASLEDCEIYDGDFAIGWMAMESRVTVNRCKLRSDVGVGIIYPPAGIAMQPDTSMNFDHTIFQTRSAFDFALLRKPERSIELTATDCSFEGSSVITLSSTGSRGLALDKPTDIRAMVKHLVVWHESNCQHNPKSNFLDARNWRTPKRWRPAGIDSNAAWLEFWRTE